MKINELNYTTKSPRLKAAASFGALMLAASSAFAATSIGWNYVGRGPNPLAATTVAGVGSYAQSEWNNHAGSGQNVGVTPLLDLFDSNGVATSTDVTAWTQVAGNSWHHGQSSSATDGSIDLMDDFASTQISLTFENIPYAFYDVVVYYGNNEGSDLAATATLNANSQNRIINTGDSAGAGYHSVGFVEETGTGTTKTNYTVFRGLADSTLNVSFTNPSNPTATGSVGARTSGKNHGISAIQIVQSQVPEPSSSLLLGTSGLLLLLRRKR